MDRKDYFKVAAGGLAGGTAVGYFMTGVSPMIIGLSLDGALGATLGMIAGDAVSKGSWPAAAVGSILLPTMITGQIDGITVAIAVGTLGGGWILNKLM